MSGVYVRGVGAWTALGETWPRSLERLRRGESGAAPIATFDASEFPCPVAAAIPACRASAEDPRIVLATAAAREAWASADLSAPRERIGVFVGAEAGRPPLATVVTLATAACDGRGPDPARFARAAAPLAQAMAPCALSPAAVASRLAAELGAQGPVETVSLACASGAVAILEAVRALRQDQCDLALCGGVGADVDPFLMAGFGLLGALSTRGVSRPFDVRRDGFVLGEGAAMVVLSRQRGDAVVEVAGVALTLDGHHLTAPEPTGVEVTRAMRLALADAGVDAVDYVQAHGTSTPLNDAVEAAAIRGLPGRPRASSVKGALGHAIGGAGAIGFLCAAEAVASGTVLPTVGLEEPDPACALAHVMGRAIEADVRAALTNSLAFGGANCSIVLRRCS